MQNEKKIGNNIICNCCCKKYIWGDPSGLGIVPSLFLLGLGNLAIFAVFLYGFMNIYFEVVTCLLYILALIHYLLCYMKDPGIVPRKYDKYKLTENEIKELLDKKKKKENEKEKNNSQENNNLINKNNVINSNGNDQNVVLQISDSEKETKKEIEQLEPINSINDKDPINQNKNLVNENLIEKEEDKDLKKNNKEEKEVKEQDIDIMPNIYKIRKCETCFINRQPTVSHCSVCDNCVFGFDHHCAVVCNCIGQRNHRNFYTLLFLGTISLIIIIIYSIYHFVYILFIYKNRISSLFVHDYLVTFIVAMSFIGLSVLLLPYSTSNLFVPCIPFATGLIIFLVIFYKAKNKKKLNYDFYYHPWSIVSAVTSLGISYSLIPMFCGQTYLIFLGRTSKSQKSIEDKLRELNDKKDEVKKNLFKEKYMLNFSCGKGLLNLIKILFRKANESLIDYEHDLGYN